MMGAIVYLHGFRSSPMSSKARLTQAACEKRDWPFACPQLPASPLKAVQMAHTVVEQMALEDAHRPIALIGSSLGGFYATCLAERFGCRAVLLNPAIYPARDLSQWVSEKRGPLTAWHSADPFEFHQTDLNELQGLTPGDLRLPKNYFLLACEGDEVLDWREMRDRYGGSKQRILPGGDHALSDYADHLDDVMDFCAKTINE